MCVGVGAAGADDTHGGRGRYGGERGDERGRRGAGAPPPTERPLAAAVVLRLCDQLNAFRLDATASQLAFAANELSAKERVLVHGECSRLKLATQSVGAEAERQLTVYKNADDVPPLPGSADGESAAGRVGESGGAQRSVSWTSDKAETRLHQRAPEEQGLIALLKESYGFIRCSQEVAGREARLFFHFTGLAGCREEALHEGAEVAFLTKHDARKKRLIAFAVRLLPPGTIQWPEREAAERVRGVVERPAAAHLDGLLSYKAADADDHAPRFVTATVPFALGELAAAAAAPLEVEFALLEAVVGAEVEFALLEAVVGAEVEFALVKDPRGGLRRATQVRAKGFRSSTGLEPGGQGGLN